MVDIMNVDDINGNCMGTSLIAKSYFYIFRRARAAVLAAKV